jgi:hypothetical protein
MQIIFGISMADAKMLRRCECYKRPMRMLKADADEHWPMRKVIFPVVIIVRSKHHVLVSAYKTDYQYGTILQLGQIEVHLTRIDTKNINIYSVH